MSKQQPATVAELIHHIEAAWNAFYAYIDTLTETQLTRPTDAAGWTAKDHLVHLSAWEDALNALLDHRPQWEGIGVDQHLWDSQDIDTINAIVQQRYQRLPLVNVRRKHREVHQRLLAKLHTLSDADLQTRICDYQPGSTDTSPLVQPLVSDTYEAYEEHAPWIAAIVAKV